MSRCRGHCCFGREEWLEQEGGKCYFLNKSPRVTVTPSESLWVAYSNRGWCCHPVSDKGDASSHLTSFFTLVLRGSLISVALCSSSLSHMLDEGCLSQKTRRQNQAQRKGVWLQYLFCDVPSQIPQVWVTPRLANLSLSSHTFTWDSLTHRRQCGKLIFTCANSKLSFARESSYLSSQAINNN